MKYVVDHDLHIHSKLSLCSGDERQTPQNILRYAEENELRTICLTDHVWDERVPGFTDCGGYDVQNYAYICQSKPLPQSEKVRFLFGGEMEMDRYLTVAMSKERCEELDFLIISTTHMHFVGFTVSKEDAATPNTLAKAWVQRLDKVLSMDLPFKKIGIAHLTCGLISRPRERFLETLQAIPSENMERLFKRAAAVGVGIELNSDDMGFADSETDTVLRPYRIAKECKCKFYCGTDAHTPEDFLRLKNYARAIDLLGLEESDKFIIGK